MQDDSQNLLTLAEAATYLEVSPLTLVNWDKKGFLKAVRIGIRGDRKYRLEDLKNCPLSINDAAKRLGVSKQTLRLWDKKGVLAPIRVEAGQRLFRFYKKEDIDKLINQPR
jgi:excisionase family DNA binding protein